jgi:hypothetical protein
MISSGCTGKGSLETIMLMVNGGAACCIARPTSWRKGKEGRALRALPLLGVPTPSILEVDPGRPDPDTHDPCLGVF